MCETSTISQWWNIWYNSLFWDEDSLRVGHVICKFQRHLIVLEWGCAHLKVFQGNPSLLPHCSSACNELGCVVAYWRKAQMIISQTDTLSFENTDFNAPVSNSLSWCQHEDLWNRNRSFTTKKILTQLKTSAFPMPTDTLTAYLVHLHFCTDETN